MCQWIEWQTSQGVEMHPRVPRSTKRTVEGLPEKPLKLLEQRVAGAARGRPPERKAELGSIKDLKNAT